ncbi:PKD-like domain-containing protein, partial [Aquimarina hainanensis]
QLICSDTILNHNLELDTNIPGSTFNWIANDNPNITGETITPSTTPIIADQLINISGDVQTVTYTITPFSPDGCQGDDYIFTVTIDPKPFVAIAPIETICSDAAINHDLTLDTNVPGTTFSWVATDNPNVSGETTTVSTSSSITDSLSNTTDLEQEVIYTITPTSPDNCVGDPYVFKVIISPVPELVITKRTLPATDGAYDTLGEAIMYEITIENPKEVLMQNITITDNNADVLSTSSIAAINANDSHTITASHFITQDDLDNGFVSNVAQVSGTDICGNIATDDSDNPDTTTPDDPTITTLIQEPSIRLLKVSDPAPDGLWDEVGEVITYSLTITNTGNVTLTDVVITDDNADIGSIQPSAIATLAPGETVSVIASHTIIQNDLDAGSVHNSASVDAIAPDGSTVTDLSDNPEDDTDVDIDGNGDPDDITTTHTPQFGTIDIVKTVNQKMYRSIGDILVYTITVTNTGNVTLNNLIIDDPILSFIGGNTLDNLAPGMSHSFTGEYIITQKDINEELVSNIATVEASLPNGTTFISEDSDDPEDPTDTDTDNDNDPEDPTISYLDSDGDGLPNTEDLDDDNDGITDLDEQNGDPFLDTDNDGIIDSLDLDADGDGVYDYIEAGHGGTDTDGDGRIEGPWGTDGISDSVQNNPDGGETSYTIQDTDGDGTPDFQDIDDDNDGLLTIDENPDPNGDGIPTDAQDTDGDGIPDYLEPNGTIPDAEDGIEVFTGMTPNGDGDNDVFTIRGIEKFENTVEIYNRWGVVVYTAKNYGKNDTFFTGISSSRATFKEKDMLPVGTYYYVISYIPEPGVVKTLKGYIYINR